jgi:hypothetical protein
MKRALAAAAIVLGAGLCAGVAYAAFYSTASNPTSSFGTKRIFPGTRSTSAWDIRDASGGSETTASDSLSYADGVITTTANFASTFASNRYIEFDFNSPAAAGLTVTSAVFNFRVAATSGTNTACFYFELYRASTSALLATYGSSGSPVGCSTTTQTTYNTTITEVTSTDTLNDLRIRVYGKESGAKAFKVDMATVTGTTAYASQALYEKIHRDQAGGASPTTTTYGLIASGDGVNYTTLNNFTSAFSSTRYVKFTFDPGIPSGSTITSVHVKVFYRSNTALDTACWYFEAYNGTTLLGSHGSTTTPQSCNTGNIIYSTDDVTLSEVSSVTNTNNLMIKTFWKESGARRVQFDLVQLDVTYYLD